MLLLYLHNTIRVSFISFNTIRNIWQVGSFLKLESERLTHEAQDVGVLLNLEQCKHLEMRDVLSD